MNNQAFHWGQRKTEIHESLHHAAGPPLVAHCIVGLARGFTSVHVWRSIRENVVDAFGGHADIFMVLKHGEDRSERHELLQPNSAWRKSLRPLAVLVLDGRNSDAHAKESSLRPSCSNAGYETVFGIVSLNGRACLQLVEAEEARRGRRYDVVTKLRPDEQICAPWPSWRQYNWRGPVYSRTIATYWRGEPGINDHVALMARDLADTYLGAFKVLETAANASSSECVNDREQFKPFCNQLWSKFLWQECLLTYWLKQSHVGYDNGRLLGAASCLWRTPLKVHQWSCRGKCEAGDLPPRRVEDSATDARWLPGYCAPTEVTQGSLDVNCKQDSQGAVRLSGRTGLTSREECVDFCYARCGNCRFVSFSRKLKDCSWYASCNMSALQQLNGPNDMQTREVNRHGFQRRAASTPSLP